jgi:hypothetical protein
MRHWIHLGTQKAGSSFLRGVLAQVPEVGLACAQELNFFSGQSDASYEAYLRQFPAKRGVLFENSPIYFRKGDSAAPAIRRVLGGKSLLLSLFLRDPVEAIVSHHEMQLRQGFFEGPHSYSGDPCDLRAFIWRNPHYLDRCRYMDLLEREWLPRFSVETFAIGTFEEFTADPAAVVRGLADRVGIEIGDTLRPEQVAKNARPSSALSQWILTQSERPALRAIRRRVMTMPALRSFAEATLFARRKSSSGADRETMRETKAELAKIFRPGVERLTEFLGRETLPWKNFFAP